MHGTGPDLGWASGWGEFTPQVWPGQVVSSYIGVFVLAMQDEGTYELNFPATPGYNMQWEGQAQNESTTTLVINDSAERRGLWNPGQTLNPDWDVIYNTCLFTKGLTLEFLNFSSVPQTVPYPLVTYISSAGGGSQITEPYPLDSAISLQFNPFGQAQVSGSITLQDPVDPEYSVHCKVYKFTLSAQGTVTVFMSDGGSWSSYVSVANIVNGVENYVGESDPNMELSLTLDAGTYYVIPQGYDTMDVGPFTLTVNK